MAVRPPAPFPPQLTGDPRDQMRQLADALSHKADLTSEPTYSAVLLIAPDRSVWRVSVDSGGALSTTVVPRT
jgi:hypothetical protein